MDDNEIRTTTSGLPPGTKIFEMTYHSPASLLEHLREANRIMDQGDVPINERDHLRVQLVALLATRNVQLVPDEEQQQRQQMGPPRLIVPQPMV